MKAIRFLCLAMLAFMVVWGCSIGARPIPTVDEPEQPEPAAPAPDPEPEPLPGETPEETPQPQPQAPTEPETDGIPADPVEPSSPATPSVPSGNPRAWTGGGEASLSARQAGCEVIRWQVNYLGTTPRRAGSGWAVLSVFDTDFLPSPGRASVGEKGTTGNWMRRRVLFDGFDGDLGWYQAYARFDEGDRVCLRMRVRGGMRFDIVQSHHVDNLVVYDNKGMMYVAGGRTSNPNRGQTYLGPPMVFTLPDEVYEVLITFDAVLASTTDDNWWANVAAECWEYCIDAAAAGRGIHPDGYGEPLVPTSSPLIYIEKVSGDTVKESATSEFAFNIVTDDTDKLDAGSLPEVELYWERKAPLRTDQSLYKRYVELEADGKTEIRIPIANDSRPRLGDRIEASLVQRDLAEAPVFYIVDQSRARVWANVDDDDAPIPLHHQVKTYDSDPSVSDGRHVLFTRDAHPKFNGDIYRLRVLGRNYGSKAEDENGNSLENDPMILNSHSKECNLTIDTRNKEHGNNGRGNITLQPNHLLICTSGLDWAHPYPCEQDHEPTHAGWKRLPRRGHGMPLTFPMVNYCHGNRRYSYTIGRHYCGNSPITEYGPSVWQGPFYYIHLSWNNAYATADEHYYEIDISMTCPE